MKFKQSEEVQFTGEAIISGSDLEPGMSYLTEEHELIIACSPKKSLRIFDPRNGDIIDINSSEPFQPVDAEILLR